MPGVLCLGRLYRTTQSLPLVALSYRASSLRRAIIDKECSLQKCDDGSRVWLIIFLLLAAFASVDTAKTGFGCMWCFPVTCSFFAVVARRLCANGLVKKDTHASSKSLRGKYQHVLFRFYIEDGDKAGKLVHQKHSYHGESAQRSARSAVLFRTSLGAHNTHEGTKRENSAALCFAGE